jgi:hypothetical protein
VAAFVALVDRRRACSLGAAATTARLLLLVALSLWRGATRGATGCGARVRRYAGAPRGAGRRGGLGGARAGRVGSRPRVGGSHGGCQGAGLAHLRVARGSNLQRIKKLDLSLDSAIGGLASGVTESVWVPYPYKPWKVT